MGYAVKYDSDKLHTYYYDKSGTLEYVYVHEKPQGTYPNRVWVYDYKGNLNGAVFAADSENSFTFDKNGTLKTKWVGNVKYDNKGKVLPMTRKLPY